MPSGKCENLKKEMYLCQCGNRPDLIWHYIKGIANRINYFAKCNNCRIRTRDRKHIDGAIEDWNTRITA
jgi:hypothetical protein